MTTRERADANTPPDLLAHVWRDMLEEALELDAAARVLDQAAQRCKEQARRRRRHVATQENLLDFYRDLDGTNPDDAQPSS